MAKPTFRELLLKAEQDRFEAELSPEDKEALPLFVRTEFVEWIEKVCLSKMNTRRVIELVINDDVFPTFHITSSFLAAACARLESTPHFEGVKIRYFEREVHWGATAVHLAGGHALEGVTVTF